MPTRPPVHQPVGSRRARAAIAAQYARTPQRVERQALYDYEWRKYSKGRLSLYPWCARCERLGRARLACVTDHTTPHKGDPVLFWDETNHQSLCKKCHDRKTRTEDGGFGSKPRTGSPR